MTRRIEGLLWARRAERPKALPKARPRGAKAAGVRYERACARALPKALPGLWWEFEDRAGRGYCQTDLVLIGSEGALVLECKYTWTEAAWDQLEGLYIPVLERALGRPCWGAQMCKVLREGASGPAVWTPREALELAKLGRRATLHWTGGGALGPKTRPSTMHPGAGVALMGSSAQL